MNRRSLLAFGCAAVTAPLSGLFARSKKVLPDGQEILGAAIKAGVEFRIESFRRSGGHGVMHVKNPVESGWGVTLYGTGPKSNDRYRWFHLLPDRPRDIVDVIARRVIANLSSEEEKALNEILSQRNGGAITVAELRELAK